MATDNIGILWDYCHWTYPLTNMAMEKCPFVDNCPIKTPSTENFQLPCLITLWGNGNIKTLVGGIPTPLKNISQLG